MLFPSCGKIYICAHLKTSYQYAKISKYTHSAAGWGKAVGPIFRNKIRNCQVP